MKPIFVTGIGTDVGKTVASAVLVQALGADYWKPVQSGQPTDRERVRELVERRDITFHPELWALRDPISPHAAAAREGQHITLDKVALPDTQGRALVIEGAGGVLVPLDHKTTILDLILHLKAAAVLVSKNYLGSINHTLLSARALMESGVPVLGIIISGPGNRESEEAITSLSGLSVVLRIPHFEELASNHISQFAESAVDTVQSLVQKR